MPQFEALIMKIREPLVGNYVYVEADDVNDALNKVAEQRPSDYYTAWVQPKPDFDRT